MEERRSSIRKGFDVVDMNNDKVGTVGEIYDNYFQMDTGFLGLGKDYFVPFDAITRIGANSVYLNTSKDRLDRMGWDNRPTERREGGFTGTRREGFEGREGLEGREQTMPLREEELEARRRSHEAGSVEVSKEVVEERRHMRVPYTEEQVYVERRPARGDRGEGEPIREGEEISIPIREEEVEVTKRPVTREELVIGKEEVTKEKEVEETVRREVPRVRREGDVREVSEEERRRRREGR